MTTTQNTSTEINTPTQRFTKEEIKTAAMRIINEVDEQIALLKNGSITPAQYELNINRRSIAYANRNLPAGLFDIDGYMIKPLHMWTKEEEAAYKATRN